MCQVLRTVYLTCSLKVIFFVKGRFKKNENDSRGKNKQGSYEDAGG